MKKLKKPITIILIILGVLLAVQTLLELQATAALSSGNTPLKLFLPTPTSVINSMLVNYGTILKDLGYTLARALIGLVLGITLAISLSLGVFLAPKIRMTTESILQAINSFPIIGFAPLIILLFGQGSDWGIVFISMLLAYFPVFVSVQHAITDIPEGIQEFIMSLKISRIKDFLFFRLSEVRGALITSLKLALPASIIGATVGEWLGVSHGLGQLIAVSLYRFQPDIMYAALFTIVAVNLLALLGINRLERHLMPYKKR